MPSTVEMLTQKSLIRPPKFVPTNTHYEAMVGSVAYGVSEDASDVDIQGFCIPPKDMVFPHLAGEIHGFGTQKKRFDQWIKHHVEDPEARKKYDMTIFSIVKYFSLCMENNPNMIDTMFVPQTCVLHITKVGQMVREQRKEFLHKGCFHRFKGYAYSQLHKMGAKNPTGNRKAIRERHGFDTKFAYHVVRLLSQVEQILTEGDLDLQEKGRREHMKAIRRGEVPEQDVRQWASDKERHLESLYHTSKLPHSPDEPKIKSLLLACLEEHYGSLDKCIAESDGPTQALREIQDVLDRNQRFLA